MKTETHAGFFAFIHRLLMRLFGPIERGKYRT